MLEDAADAKPGGRGQILPHGHNISAHSYSIEMIRAANEHVVGVVGRSLESNEDGLLQLTQPLSAHLVERVDARPLDRLADVVVVLDAHGVHHEQHRRQHEQQEHLDGHREHAQTARRRRRRRRRRRACRHRPSSSQRRHAPVTPERMHTHHLRRRISPN